MHSSFTGDIVRTEWRWVTSVSIVLVFLACLPHFMLASTPRDDGWYYMGALHDFQNAAAYLSRMEQATAGNWLTRFLYTPEVQAGTFVNLLYAILGYLSQLTNISVVTIFHIARFGAGFLMYLAIYQLGASIWMRVRTRRIFFVLASVASGLGWLYSLVYGDVLMDLSLAQAYPFFSTLVNVHYPLAIASLALLGSVLLPTFLPGNDASPTIENGGTLVILLSLILSSIYLEALIPLALAVVGSTIANGLANRYINPNQVRWLAWLVVPALPIATYFGLLLMSNQVVVGWVDQRADIVSPPLQLLLAIGLPMLIALPGLWRAVRRFEPDGDRFMLLWLLSMLGCMYILPMASASVLIGMMLPVAYFGARAIEDFWFTHIKRSIRPRFYIIGVPLLMMSNIFVFIMPLLPVSVRDMSSGIFLEQEYFSAFEWLKTRTLSEDVVLASPSDVSVWIPPWVNASVYYGHSTETRDAAERREVALEWYSIADESSCAGFAQENGDPGFARVSYVIYGPREARIGSAACIDQLRLVQIYGDVAIYATRNARVTRR